MIDYSVYKMQGLRTLAVALALLVAGTALAAAEPESRAVAAHVADAYAQRYVFPARGAAAAALLRANANAGAYDMLEGNALAERLTADLRSVLHDQHAYVRYFPDILPPSSGNADKPTPQELAEGRERERMIGYGVARAAVLPGNIGYLDLRAFTEPDPQTLAALEAAVTLVSGAEAVIVDVRRNGGGNSETVAALAGHFLGPGVHVNDFVGRGDGDAAPVRERSFTPKRAGTRITAPLFVLTSKRTFSGAEEFAYDMQTQKRATLIGETTGGGANPGEFVRVDDHFRAFVSDGRARNPITGTNWEGTGVRPDVEVASDQALVTAYRRGLGVAASDPALSPAGKRFVEMQVEHAQALTEAQLLGT